MRTHIPAVGGQTTTMVAKRRKVLIRLLNKLTVDADGCMITPTRAEGIPTIHWPSAPAWVADGRTHPRKGGGEFCLWPGGCTNRPAKRQPGSNARNPAYCYGPDPITGELHSSKRAAMCRERRARAKGTFTELSVDKPIPFLLLQLYAPDAMAGVRAVKSTCHKHACVNPSHYQDLKVWMADRVIAHKIRAHYTRDQVREVIRLRYDELLTLQQVESKTGIPFGRVSDICNGKAYADWTLDLREGKPKHDGRAVLGCDLVRAVVQARIDNPAETLTEIGKRFGLSRDRVSGIMRGRWYASHTEDLRELL
jgi:hypothetical protein